MEMLAAYQWHPSEQWEIAPRAGLNVTYLHRDGFSETGATNAVSYDDLDKVFADGLLGVRATYAGYQVEDTFITPYLGAGVIHSMGSGDVTVRQYLTTTSAEVTTQNDSNRLTTECGVTFGKGTTSFTLAYNGEHGETMDAHTVFGTLRWVF